MCAWRCGFVRALEVEKTYTGRAAAGEGRGGDGGGRWAFKERREDDGQRAGRKEPRGRGRGRCLCLGLLGSGARGDRQKAGGFCPHRRACWLLPAPFYSSPSVICVASHTRPSQEAGLCLSPCSGWILLQFGEEVLIPMTASARVFVEFWERKAVSIGASVHPASRTGLVAAWRVRE